MKNLLYILLFTIIAGGGVFVWEKFFFEPAIITSEPVVTPINKSPVVVTPTPPELPPVDKNLFESITLTSSDLGAELTEKVGALNVFTVLAINRIDDKNLTKGMTMVIPKSFDDPSIWEFMPNTITSAQNIPKLIIISQEMQVFGAYEFGNLVRSGPVSSGKQSTQTPSRLYFMNWKGKEVKSTFSDEWILKWNFNINNFLGISIHQYALPGYPASHSCVRLYAENAEWIYNWADQWIVSKDEQTKLASGTPVIIYGEYNFKKKAPWKNLPTNPDATKISADELEILVQENFGNIDQEATNRAQVLGELN